MKNKKQNRSLNYSEEHLRYLKKENKTKAQIIINRIAILIILLALWEVLTRVKILNAFLYSSPSRIYNTLVTLFKEGSLFKHTFITFYETVLAFTISMVIGAVIAIILFSFEKVRKVLEPYLVVFNSLPKIALGPLIIIWCGAGTKAIVLMGFLICIIITIVTLLNAFLAVDQDKILLMKTMGASKLQILTKLILPECFPTFISVLKINVGMSWVGTIMGEYLVSKAGLGYLIVYGGYIFKLDLVMAAVLILCILASIMYFFVSLLESVVTKKRN